LIYCAIETVWWVNSDDFKKDYEAWKKRWRSSKETGSVSNQPSTEAASASLFPRPTIQSRTKETGYVLMMPIWFRQKRGHLISEASPEWKVYHGFLNDRKHRDEIVRKIIKTALGMVGAYDTTNGNLQYIQSTGQVVTNMTAIPPIFTPPSYEVPAMVVSSTGVGFFWKTLSSPASARTERIFHPTVTIRAFFAGLSTFSWISYQITRAKILDYVNGKKWSTRDQSQSNEQDVINSLPLTKVPKEKADLLMKFLRGDTSQDSPVKRSYRTALGAATYKDAIQNGVLAFRMKLAENQSLAVQSQEYGAVIMKGNMDLHGQRGILRVEIEAYYLPKEDALLGMPRILNTYIVPNYGSFAKPLPQAPTAERGHLDPPAQEQSPPIDGSQPTEEKPTPGKDEGK
jgi:hypothetical protein